MLDLDIIQLACIIVQTNRAYIRASIKARIFTTGTIYSRPSPPGDADVTTKFQVNRVKIFVSKLIA